MTQAQDDFANDDFVSISGFKSFENVGDSITGVYIGSTYETGETNASGIHQYMFLTETDGIQRVNETAQLGMLRNIPKGTVVRVVYKGESEKTSNGFKVRIFDVKISRSAMAAMSSGLKAAAVSGTLHTPPHDPFAE